MSAGKSGRLKPQQLTDFATTCRKQVADTDTSTRSTFHRATALFLAVLKHVHECCCPGTISCPSNTSHSDVVSVSGGASGFGKKGQQRGAIGATGRQESAGQARPRATTRASQPATRASQPATSQQPAASQPASQPASLGRISIKLKPEPFCLDAAL